MSNDTEKQVFHDSAVDLPHPAHLPRMANFYESGPLDRQAVYRGDTAWIQTQLARPETRILPVWRGSNLVSEENDLLTGAPQTVYLSPDDELVSETTTLIFLGLADETAYFAADLSHLEEAPAAEGEFRDLRAVGPIMPHAEGSILAYARGLSFWHGRHRFCGICGHATLSGSAGHVRICTNRDCGAQHFPRTDPAVIMLIHDGAGNALLGRQRSWAPGMHSTLAGYVEPGEGLEDAVAREVMEESGIAVRDIRYHSSQPWPFPSSIMLGFFAEAATKDIQVDEDELESADWFSRDFLLNSPENESFRLPRRDSIARRLIETWLKG
ncbi:MAG: NAD(+) diphosphatase [Alphaproteobacteria bacterium]